MDKYQASIVVLFCKVMLVFGVTMFFHEPSRIMISPPEAKDTDFGFSVAYQDNIDGNLLIGAPHVNNSILGNVYVCPVVSIINNRPSCTPVRTDLAALAPDTEFNLINSKQSFCLGASIAATPDYFVSCAPLWSTKVHLLNGNGKTTLRSVGTCFIYNGTETSRFYSNIQQYNHANLRKLEANMIDGEIGWSAYYDKTHQKILLGKPSDIVYLDATNPHKKAESMINDYFKSKNQALRLDTKFNMGQSITAGNYFVNSKHMPKSYYAVTLQKPRYLGGEVQFLEYTEKKGKKGRLLPIIEVQSISGPRTAMFGMSVFSADFDRDGIDDLLVGAPAHTKDPLSYETGAIFIYLGGHKRIGDITRMFSVHGMKDGSRFGAALAANDIDGDGIPEIFVSAPYEYFDSHSTGALYILTGSEIQDVILNKRYKVNLNDLRYTQKIKAEGVNTFGYTVQVVPDINSNGCDELAVGSPGSATVVLLKCIPRITATLSLTLYKNDKQDVVNVCVDVSYPEKPEIIVTKLKVVCEVTENGAQILGSNVVQADLSSRLSQYCANVTVNYLYKESLSHQFIAKLDVEHLANEFSQYEFNNGWVTLSQYSKTEDRLNIMKPCLGNDCEPALEAHFLDNNEQPVSDIYYTIGQSETENITLAVVSRGIPTFGCVQLNVNAPATIPCVRDSTESYLCNLKPIERDQRETLKMVVKMNEFTSEDTLLNIKAKWYPECHNKRAFNSTELNIHLKLIPQVYINRHEISQDDSRSVNRLRKRRYLIIFIKSTSRYLNITEKEIEEEKKTKLNDSNNIIKDIHEYTIINENSVHWINVPAEIRMDKKPFILSYKMQTTQPSDCKQTEDTNRTIFNCFLSLKSRSSSKIVIATEILKNKIRDNMKDKKAEIYSNVTVRLLPTDEVIRIYQKTIILLKKEPHEKNNKIITIVIAVIVAMLILALISYLLYKVGFFERESKKQLDTMRETIKRKNSRAVTKQENNSAHEVESDENNDDLEISVDEDNDFEVVRLDHCNIDTTALIETKPKEKTEEEIKPKQDNPKEVTHNQINNVELTSRSNDKLI